MTNTPITVPPNRFRLSRFDRAVAAVVGTLLIAITLTIVIGDRVGVQIERHEPATDSAASTATVSFTFDEPMDWDSVIDRLRFEPALEGDFQSVSRTLRFIPAQPLLPGGDYAVTLEAGAMGRSGRQVLEDTGFTFQIHQPRIAYLTPADAVPQNIWIEEPGQPDSAEQVTFSPTSVVNFDISPDGTQLAFSEQSEVGTSNIKLLDLNTGDLRQITACADSTCTGPVWRPDGAMIAYDRIDLNSDIEQLGVSPTRVWLIDLSGATPTERPLFTDNQILGYSPQWSADGRYIAVFDNSSRGIVVYDMQDGTMTLIPTRSGSDIALSPDGTRVVFPRLIIDQAAGSARSILQIADLDTGAVTDLIDPERPIDDAQTAWNPNGRLLAVARRYIEPDERTTRTRQLYLLNTESGEEQELIFDPRYYHSFFSWDAFGQQLVIQRFPERTETGEINPDGRPEVWTYNLETDTLEMIAQNAYLPRWVP
ncbi:MAG: hypothetical protein CL610_23005 [Anaerolineaceae bacterium]|nr:hypothetical protein [Anaerolineaceae bacterium]